MKIKDQQIKALPEKFDDAIDNYKTDKKILAFINSGLR